MTRLSLYYFPTFAELGPNYFKWFLPGLLFLHKQLLCCKWLHWPNNLCSQLANCRLNELLVPSNLTIRVVLLGRNLSFYFLQIYRVRADLESDCPVTMSVNVSVNLLHFYSLLNICHISHSFTDHSSYSLQHASLLCPSLSPKICSNSCALSQWWYLIVSPSAAPFSSCLQPFPA